MRNSSEMSPSIELMSLQGLAITIPLILSLLLLYKKWHHKKTVIPPSPPRLPILGNIHQLGRHPHRSLHSMSKQYGELMLVHVGSQPTLVVSSAGAARQIMITHDVIFANRPVTKRAEKLGYNFKDIVAAPYGEHWRQRRNMCAQHLLNNNTVHSFRSTRVEETAVVVEKIRQAEAESSAVNLSAVFLDYTNDVVGRLVLGRNYESDDGTNIKRLINEYMRVIGDFNIGDFIPCLAWISRLNGWDSKADKVFAELDQFFEKVIMEHQDHDHNSDKSEDFVDALLNIHKDPNGFPIDRDTIKALMLNMLSAGTDTTAIILEWTMAELVRHPQVMQQVQKEVRDINGEHLDINDDELCRMKYLKAVMKETLRLHLPIPLLSPRQPIRDTKILGYDVPAGTAVTINGWAIHRDPSYWHEPHTFNPDRFMNNSSIDFRGLDLQFVPFGAGRRICPGISLAMANSELLLANLLLKFDWKLPGGIESRTLDMSERSGITVPRNSPLIVVPLTHTSTN